MNADDSAPEIPADRDHGSSTAETLRDIVIDKSYSTEPPPPTTTDFESPSEIETRSALEFLNFLTEENPRIRPADQASLVFASEARRRRLIRRALKCLAFASTLLLVISGWFIGSRGTPSEQAQAQDSLRLAPFLDLLSLKFDDGIISAIFDVSSRSALDDLRPIAGQEIILLLRDLSRSIDTASTDATLRDIRQRYQSLTPESKRRLNDFANRADRLPESEKPVVLSRIAGMRVLNDSFSEAERRYLERLSPQDRWAFVLRRAEQQRKQIENSKMQPFSVVDFNRPDYLMDLATLTVAWVKLTPSQKSVVERRSRNLKSDPARKVDRVRQLAQILEGNLPEGPGFLQDPARPGPLQRVLAKAEAQKQDREKRRAAFQQIVRNPVEVRFQPVVLERFLDTLPPWLSEAVDPLPPEEARRFLSILKLIVDHQLAEAANAKNES